MYFVYIIQSATTRRYYVGLTSNVSKRLTAHNSGTTKSTVSGRPWALVHQERFHTRVEAREREKYLKSYSGAGEKQAIIRASADSYSRVV